MKTKKKTVKKTPVKKTIKKSASVKAAKPKTQLILRSASQTQTLTQAATGKEIKEPELTSKQISSFKDILLQKREDLLTIVQRKKEQEIEEAEVGDEADIATRSVEKEMLFELTDSEKHTLDHVEAALRRIEKGVFGACEYCRKPVARLRLDVMPWARYCIRCQAQQEIPSAE